MKNAWKIILIITISAAALGILAFCAGLLTGASTDRIIEVVFGGREMLDLLIQTLKEEFSTMF